MLRVGIIGLGFMGKMHYETYQALAKSARVAAIADVDPKKLAGDWSSIGGNIATSEAVKVDLAGVKTYADADDLVGSPDIDVVDITLPTHLHCEFAVKALKAGKHVFCEKPMAVNSADAGRMVDAARESGKLLLIGQCIRFWPSYVKTREIVLGGEYGAVKTAVFRRFSTTPTWSWDNWILDAGKSGLAALDLHIHDADFVSFLFGLPAAVTSVGGGTRPGGFEHIVTSYAYPDGKLVVAEGAWEYAPGYPFSMAFSIHMEKASLDLAADGKLTLYPMSGAPEEIKVDAESGYWHEMVHYFECIARGAGSDILTPESARDSVRLVEAEVESARSGKRVAL